MFEIDHKMPLSSFAAFFMIQLIKRENRNKESMLPLLTPVLMRENCVNLLVQMAWPWQSWYSIIMIATILDGIP